jgi:hypothetical protein
MYDGENIHPKYERGGKNQERCHRMSAVPFLKMANDTSIKTREI